MRGPNSIVYRYFIVYLLPCKTATTSKILELNVSNDAVDVNAENVP